MSNTLQAQYTALNVLKQRCEYLERRLESLEEENCQLKSMRTSTGTEVKIGKSSGQTTLEDQVVLLNKQNLRMSRQVELMTVENQNLWSKLSKLISGSDDLGFKLSLSGLSECPRVSDKFSDPSKSLSDVHVPNLPDDYNKESLEEISLKLINGILMGKTELENQYSQMIDLQRENNLTDNCNYSNLPLQFDSQGTLNLMNVSIQKMKDFKQVLHQQRVDLKKAIASVKNLPNDFAQNNNKFRVKNESLLQLPTATGNSSTSDSNKLAQQEEVRQEDGKSESDKVCPMCAKVFTGSFNNFFEHVNTHFEDGTDEYASARFEMVP